MTTARSAASETIPAGSVGETQAAAASTTKPLPRFSPGELAHPTAVSAPAGKSAVTGTAPASRPVIGTTGLRHVRRGRRLSRRRRITEQVVIVLIFLVALGVTVLLLASQWLLNASVTGAIRVPLSTLQTSSAT